MRSVISFAAAAIVSVQASESQWSSRPTFTKPDIWTPEAPKSFGKPEAVGRVDRIEKPAFNSDHFGLDDLLKK